jgi:hypothetical protein
MLAVMKIKAFIDFLRQRRAWGRMRRRGFQTDEPDPEVQGA